MDASGVAVFASVGLFVRSSGHNILSTPQAMFALSLPFPSCSVVQSKHISSDAQRAPQTPQSILSISGLLGALSDC